MAVKCPKCQSDNPDDTIYCGKCATPLKSAEEISITKTIITPAERLQKGSTIAGRYQILEELGRGGMGVVYKAEDTKLKRTVALKFLPPELTHISEVKERFMREAQAAAALDHPNICTVYEFDEAEEKTFISMAYVEGQSLKKKIESGPLELDEAIRIGLQVAEGLQKAHKKGVVHRDIKSANIMVTEEDQAKIMVTEEDQAKIMDFGLARIAGGTLVTKEGMTMGTIAYMSPEQARGEEVDHRTDIWSFGVVLYEMFSGQLPFKGEHDQAVVYSILKENPKPITDLRSEIPMAIEQVVGKALEKNLDERYQHIEELVEDLRSISEGIVPEAIKARVRKAKLLRRKRAILYAGIALTWATRSQFGLLPPHEAVPQAKAAAEKAVELDNTLAEAQYALAGVRAWHEWDWEGAETAFRRAIELNPSYPDVRAFYSHFLNIMGNPDEAMAQIERALELDPFNAMFQALYGMDLLYVRRYDDAIAQFQNVLRTVPNDLLAHSGLWSAYYAKRMYEEVLAEERFFAVGDREAEDALARGLAEGAYPGAMNRLGEMWEARSRKRYVSANMIAEYYVAAGKNDRAFEWLEQGFQERNPNMPYFNLAPAFEPLRDDSRFKDLLRRMNLPELQ